MSYCVNCGVELDKTLSECPLCHTKVYNPNQPVDTESPSLYPNRPGIADIDTNREFTILMTVIFGITSLVCGILNIFIFPFGKWSLYVINACIVFWIFLLPMFFPSKVNRYACLILDGLSVSAYIGVISYLHPGNGWYLHIALPLILLLTILFIGFAWLCASGHGSFLNKTIMFFADLGIFCSGLELFIRFHFKSKLTLTWSAVVLTSTFAVAIILFIISRQSGLRSEIRKRLHF